MMMTPTPVVDYIVKHDLFTEERAASPSSNA